MSSKLLYSLSDEKKDLQKQIGCMNGFFQLFDRQHFLSTRRLKNDAIKRLPSGQTGNRGPEAKNAFRNKIDYSHEMVREKQRTSTESSRTSVSSSSWSSSYSSLECNKTNLHEQSIYNQANFPETPSRNIPVNQLNPSHSRRQSFDLQDVVKDKIHKRVQGLSVKTATKEKVTNHKFKHVDSPRPAQLLNSPKPSSLRESPRIPGKLGEAASRFENRSGSLPLRDASRFSYDGTELQVSSRSSMKLKELPRLSLDSRRGSTRDCSSTIRPSHLSADLQRGRGAENNYIDQQEPETYRGPSSVVAKLMGLEAFPSVAARINTQSGPNISCQNEHAPQSKSSKFVNERDQDKTPRSSMEGISPMFRNSESVVKSCRTSKIPIEPAPWRQQGETKGSCQSTPKSQESPKNLNSFPSVYGEIEKRLTELEFCKSGKDLRALKQILESMQKTKERLETGEESYSSNSVPLRNNKSTVNRSFETESPRSTESDSRISSTVKGAKSSKNFKSPILIKRPSELVENGSSATVRSVDDSPTRLKKLWTGESINCRRDLVNPRNILVRDISAQPPSSKDRNTRAPKQSKVLQNREGESFSSLSRSSGSVSPRPRQKKVALVNNSQATTASTDSRTPRSIRQCSKQSTEPGSPRRKSRPKTSSLQPDGVQIKRISKIGYQRDQFSMSSQLSSTSNSHIETEGMSTDGLVTVTCRPFDQADKIQTNLFAMSDEEKSVEGATKVTLEQPSPVSVLEAAFYREEPPSPIKKISSALRDELPADTDEAEQNTSSLDHFSPIINPGHTTKISHYSIPSLHDFAPYLEQTNSTHETPVELFAKTNHNHRYILEILLASGLLTGADHDVTDVQLHSPGHLLDPNLSFKLEEAKATAWSSDVHEENGYSNHYKKTERQLTSDAVNEILLRELVLESSLRPWCSMNRMAKRRLTGKQFFRDVCTKVDLLQANNPHCMDDEEDHLKGVMLWDLANESVSWTDCGQELPGIVLDVERLIFKDLINEVVTGEVGVLKIRADQHCRQLFY